MDESDNNSGHEPKRRRDDKSPSMDPNESDDGKETINCADKHFVFQAGHKFFLLYGPWIRSGDGLFEIHIDQHFNPSERFENDQNKSQGQLKEVLNLLQMKFQSQTVHQRWLQRQVSLYHIPQSHTYL
jgi:hypothetical protein